MNTNKDLEVICVYWCPLVAKKLIEASWMQRATGPAHDLFGKTVDLPVEIQSGLIRRPEGRQTVWSGTAVSYSPALYTQTHRGFPKLHPRSLLERR